MRRLATLVTLTAYAAVAPGCSFVGVRGPSDRVSILPEDGKLRCTESALLPGLDALGGAAAIAVAGGGVILENASDDGKPEHFTRYYAGPLVAVAVAYFVAASFGNERITWCTDAKERMASTRSIVRPIEPDPPR